MEGPLPKDELECLVEAWIVYQVASDGSQEKEAARWANDEVDDWRHEANSPENLWQFITAAYSLEMPSLTFAILAAGPLEDLLADHGPIYIDRVEELARRDPTFNHLLGGVWQNAMPEEVWDRVEKVRTNVW